MINTIMAQSFEEFINKAKTKHNNFYTYSEDGYRGASKKVTVYCPIHGAFIITGSIHLYGQGCASCARDKRASTLRLHNSNKKISNFTERAIEKHGNKYDYSLSTCNGLRSKIKIICPKHGVFEQMVQAHIINGQGCPTCAKEHRVGPKKIEVLFDKTALLSLLSSEQLSKYDYSLVPENSVLTGIKLICHQHGEFAVNATSHASHGRGCKICGTDKRIAARAEQSKLSLLEFISKANAKHNHKYDYSKTIYSGTKNMVVITCPIHGDFLQRARDHINGNGCQKCGRFATSYMEHAWLDKHGISIRNKKIKIGSKNMVVDGFCPETNTIYEFLGDFWHGNPAKYDPAQINARNKIKFGDLYKATLTRFDIFRSAGYNLIFIWETDWLNENRV